MSDFIKHAYRTATGRCATLTVAANDSSALSKQQADYVCDGTGDQVEIQAAIDALPSGGGKISLLEGTFVVGVNIFNGVAAIRLPSNTYLQGQGAATIIKLGNNVLTGIGQGVNILRNHTDDAYNIMVSDLTIDGNKSNNTPVTVAEKQGTSGIGFIKTYNCVVQNVIIHDAVCSGINLETAPTLGDNNHIVNYCNIYDCAHADSMTIGGLCLDKVTGCIISSSTVHGVRGYGVDISLSYRNTVQNVQVRDNITGGLRVTSNSENNIVSNIYSYSNDGYGIDVSSSDNNIISNILSDSNNVGFVIESSSLYNNIDDCIAYNNLLMGFLISSSDHNSITNCFAMGNSQSTDNTSDGIVVDISLHCNIQNNVVRHLDGAKQHRYGIYVQSVSSNCIVSGNDLYLGGKTANFNDPAYNSVLSSEKHTELLMDVLAVSTTHVRSNEDLSVATPIIFTLDAQPDVPRTLSWLFDTHAQITEYDMEVIGVDAKGNTITETWDETAGWSGETSNAFATVTSIKMTSRTGTGAADTMDIGITDVLGLSNIIYETSDVFKIKKNNANATVATAQVNTTYNTYDMSVIGLAATDDFTIWYKSNLNIIS